MLPEACLIGIASAVIVHLTRPLNDVESLRIGVLLNTLGAYAGAACTTLLPLSSAGRPLTEVLLAMCGASVAIVLQEWGESRSFKHPG